MHRCEYIFKNILGLFKKKTKHLITHARLKTRLALCPPQTLLQTARLQVHAPEAVQLRAAAGT